MIKILCIVQTPVPSTEISIIRPFSYREEHQEIAWELVKEASFNWIYLIKLISSFFIQIATAMAGRSSKDGETAQIPMIDEIDDNYFDIPEDLPVDVICGIRMSFKHWNLFCGLRI